MNPREAIIALNMLPKIGPVRVRRMLDCFGSAEKILQADIRSLIQVEGIGPETAEIIRDWENRIDLSGELAEVEKRGLSVVTQLDSQYPEALRQSYDPPLVLYVWGELTEVDRHAIAIVGSRKTSIYGTQTARQLAFQLASSGMTIVSGLARGIDTHGHEGALAAQSGRTIAVIGSGLGQIYPPENMALADKIAGGRGAVVSEFPLHTQPSKKTFPMRNRIVAAWSQAVVVVECPEWSGARITANLAGDMGKTIYAVPGQIDRPTSAGCNALIREGAILVTGGHDILEDMATLPLHSATNEEASVPSEPSLTGAELAIYSSLEDGALLIDDLLEMTGLPLPEVNATLLKLEIMGRITQLAGNRFARK